MAGFFSLGSVSGSGREDPPPPNNNQTQPGLVLYRNEEVYNNQKGFEIWQQLVQVHHHQYPNKAPFLHHQQHHLYLGGGDVGPSGGTRAMMRSQGGTSSTGMNCQDCGNQAKKDCVHMRCRTCCKSRGFDCSTHVKSTWVPAAKRRERHQHQLLALQHQQQQQQQQQPEMVRDKRQRETTPTTRLGSSTSGLEVGQHFPAELTSPAVFRCVRVHSVNDADEQLAYQTAINIGGHLFKGILYDQGPDIHLSGAGDTSNSGAGAGHHHHDLLTASAANNEVVPNAVYPQPPMSAFLAGTQFFPPPRS